jgi:hypothetical protein
MTCPFLICHFPSFIIHLENGFWHLIRMGKKRGGTLILYTNDHNLSVYEIVKSYLLSCGPYSMDFCSLFWGWEIWGCLIFIFLVDSFYIVNDCILTRLKNLLCISQPLCFLLMWWLGGEGIICCIYEPELIAFGGLPVILLVSLP